MKRWVVATGNAHKVMEMQAMLEGLGVQLVSPRETGLRLDPEEWGATFATNAAIKAIAWAAATGLPALADDSGLEVDALDGAPGVRSARYAGEGASDEANVAKLLDALDGVEAGDRGARFRCVLALAEPAARAGDAAAAPTALEELPAEGVALVDGRWRVTLATGTLEGVVARERRGAQGFGYDPVLRLEDGRHVAELDAAEKNARSHRGQAMAALVARLGLRDAV